MGAPRQHIRREVRIGVGLPANHDEIVGEVAQQNVVLDLRVLCGTSHAKALDQAGPNWKKHGWYVAHSSLPAPGKSGTRWDIALSDLSRMPSERPLLECSCLPISLICRFLVESEREVYLGRILGFRAPFPTPAPMSLLAKEIEAPFLPVFLSAVCLSVCHYAPTYAGK